MRKIILFTSLILGLSTFSVFSQGIQFEENHDLNAALTKAKAEKKLIFIDAYAVWCGPCKVMARDIFPLKEVGDFFNVNFVNMKLDMEAKENVDIAKKYEVKAYPTYLFLNADGELVHKGLGSMPAGKFIEVAKTATDSENNFSALSGKIKKGDRSLATINKYLAQNPYDKDNGALVDSYFLSLSENQIYTKENWELFNNFVDNISSPSFQYFIQNREKIATLVGKDKTDSKIAKIMITAYNQDPASEEKIKNIDPSLFEEAKAKVNLSKAYSQFRKANDMESWKNFISMAAKYYNNSKNANELNEIAWMVFKNNSKFSDKELLKQGLEWANKAITLQPGNDAFLDTYANLLYASGKKKEAINAETNALKIAEKAGNTEAVENYKKVIEEFKNK